jgi:hypothetical protein
MAGRANKRQAVTVRMVRVVVVLVMQKKAAAIWNELATAMNSSY